ncbi:MAG: hypothetical protein ACN2B6_08255 [Rickettsiales bacterium]
MKTKFFQNMSAQDVIWFFARAAVFCAAWWYFIDISSWYYFHHIHDVGSTYWSIGLVMAMPFVVFTWLLTDLIFWRKKATLKKLWKVTFISIVAHTIISPLWGGAIWLIYKHITEYIGLFYFIIR